MRTSAFTAAILALATLASTLPAADDFSALLADLSFGDAPSLNEPLSVANKEPIADLQPVPTGIAMPEMVESTPQVEEVEATPEVESPPQVALQDPIPATTPEPPTQIDLEAAFALQAVQSANTEVPSQVVGHVHNQCDNECCDLAITCIPRNKPNLPSSTFHQYFRSNACYSNVWDGYQQSCGPCKKHLTGECDCFKKSSKHKWYMPTSKGCAGNGCASCDSGCDR